MEVVPCALQPVMDKLRRLGGKPVLRMGGSAKAGPVVSDNGNLIVDVDFGAIPDPRALHIRLVQVPGIVDTGLFIAMACKAFFGQADGSVTTQENPKNTPFDDTAI